VVVVGSSLGLALQWVQSVYFLGILLLPLCEFHPFPGCLVLLGFLEVVVGIGSQRGDGFAVVLLLAEVVVEGAE
jgi:hypothetical protein